MCGFSPFEFVIVALLVATIAGPRLLAWRRRPLPKLRPPRALAGRPEPWRVVIGLGAILLVGLVLLRFGSRLAPLLARLVRGPSL